MSSGLRLIFVRRELPLGRLRGSPLGCYDGNRQRDGVPGQRAVCEGDGELTRDSDAQCSLSGERHLYLLCTDNTIRRFWPSSEHVESYTRVPFPILSICPHLDKMPGSLLYLSSVHEAIRQCLSFVHRSSGQESRP